MSCKFSKSENGWKTSDIDIQDVSIIRSYRSQFSRILREGTPVDLMIQLISEVIGTRTMDFRTRRMTSMQRHYAATMMKWYSLIILFYDRVVLARPLLFLFCLLSLISFLGYKATDFRMDASTETLILETDEDLRYSRLIESRYGSDDYLLLTYTPESDLFSDEALIKLTSLRDELRLMKNVSSVFSILNAPLLKSPSVPFRDMLAGIRTLESSTVDRSLARNEFKKSHLYQNLLVSPDLKTTALQIKFHTDAVYQDLLVRRDALREKKLDRSLSAIEMTELKKTTRQLQEHRDEMKKIRHQDIVTVRTIMDNYREDAVLFLGGISMITDDLITFIRNDLKIFGIGVLCFLIITLGAIFGNLRWVLLPIICCACSAITMMGLLGMFGWPVTVISSNFISLQLIITMAISIHLIVRYRDLLINNPDASQRTLILDTGRLMVRPLVYSALTTIVGFGSLLLCDILPVKTFAWMMMVGIIVSLMVTHLLFPAGLMLLDKKPMRVRRKPRFSPVLFLAGFTISHGKTVLVTSGIILIISALGISRLTVENSFIDYFKDSTEIHQGMKVIDQKLGGTTPLDVIIDIVEPEAYIRASAPEIDDNDNSDFDSFDEFDETEDDDKYWFTAGKMAQATKIHDYLDNLPETGKVMSLAIMLKITKDLNKGKPLDSFQLAVLYSKLPDTFKTMLFKPYVSVPHNQLRFSIRVKDSEKSLDRNELLKRIRKDLVGQLGLSEDQIHLTGMLVLYNNMLQSLFESQILTLGVVVLVLMAMFLILFRSLKVALIAIAPNLLAIGVVLGVMGWLNIPLDMMTITVAAISIGIASDNTIHYLYRFIQEFKTHRNYVGTLQKCHEGIGYAMYYTSVTIIMGFSILTLSNFLPSIYFGLLTGLAMIVALIAALTLLPQLLIVFKPFGPEIEQQPHNA